MPTMSSPRRAGISEGPSANQAQLPLEPGVDPALQQKMQIEKLQADIHKAEADVLKTQAEVANIQEIGPRLNRLVTITTSLAGLAGAVFGAIIAALVAWLGQRINRNYNIVQSEKLRQDRELEHEKHSLELYKSLGSDNPRGQFAAAAVLLQRLEHLSGDGLMTGEHDALADRITITHVLISVLKEQTDEPNFTILRKHIADNMVKRLNIVSSGGHLETDNSPSFLANFDIQKCKLKDVFWRGVNLRNVDLYGSDLAGASLRNADLRNAVLYQCDLSGCRFNEANLEGANLEGAHVEKADFSTAKLTNAILRNTKFDDSTKWPIGFDPIPLGAVKIDTALSSAGSYPY